MGEFMKYNKDNVIYIDFIFKRKRINSKTILFFYKLYSKLITILPNKIKLYKSKKTSLYNNRKTSNY